MSGHQLNVCMYGDALARLRELPDECVHAVCTSPPFFGLRDYGRDGQIGLEATPEEYAERLVEVFREVRRVLRDDGTLWLNLGDSYGVANNRNSGARQTKPATNTSRDDALAFNSGTYRSLPGLKPKDLIGVPWRVAFALQADGWWLRSDIIWNKPNPMPESVTDRPTKTHEHVFLLAKSARYFYDAEAVREPQAQGTELRHPTGRNRRDVWTITTAPHPGAHFACWPPNLVSLMILAGTSGNGSCAGCGAPSSCDCDAAERRPCVVLDPFMGSGTTAMVAQDLGRDWIGIELNEDYRPLIEKRTAQLGLFGGRHSGEER